MRAFEAEEMVKKHCTNPNSDVRQTAEFVLKRFERFKLSDKEYVPSGII
jgi:hypothetical protein